MHPSLPAVRLLAAVACGADAATVGERREEATDEARLLQVAGALGMTLALDAVAESLGLAVDTRRRLVAGSMVVALARDNALHLLGALHDAGVPSSRAVVIKGGAVALAMPAEAHRAMCDVDVVVPDADVPAWIAAAERVGINARRTTGYEVAYLTRDRGMIELHLALPGFAGNDAGPNWDALHRRAHRVEGGSWLVPDAPVAREIAVQHFLFHHGGEAGHALRTLQDLTLLDDGGEGDGLEWGNPAVARATARMREIARAIREGRDSDPDADAFLSSLATILGEQSSRSFAEESRHWIEQQRGAVARLRLLARRVAPPVSEMRKAPDDSTLTIAVRYARRPFDLLGKYRAAARADKGRGDAITGWRAEIERLGR
ncbi:MAG: nucleotidyltransferase family protein [Thermoanaerobaculia bacterium]|jgi:hypothetical protein